METQVIQLTSEQFTTVITHLNNIELGIKYILVYMAAYFVWFVAKLLYKFFGGVMLGGV